MQIVWVTTGSILHTLDLCEKAEDALTDALNKTGLPWEVSATLHFLPMERDGRMQPTAWIQTVCTAHASTAWHALPVLGDSISCASQQGARILSERSV